MDSHSSSEWFLRWQWSRTQQKSFDNVISAGEQCRRQFETERLSSLKIDEQLNFAARSSRF